MSDPLFFEENTAAYELLKFPTFKNAGVGSPSQPSSFLRQKIAEEPNIVLPTAAELEAIQNQAREEGYQSAYSEGTQRMSKLLNSIEQAMRQADQNMAQDILDLSLEIARQMVRQTLKTKPEVLLTTIREAIANLPHFNHGAHLVVHPDDAIIVRDNMGEQLNHSGWKIFEDATITRGGARIETSNSQIDATVENRWQRIVASIGQDSVWTEE